jgi:hypothetical protein
MKPRAFWLGGLALLALLSWSLWRSQHAAKSVAAVKELPLYTGKEPLRKVRLTFPSKEKPGFVQEDFQIYATQSLGAQIKQVLLLLFRGPRIAGAALAFPPAGSWKYREAFIADSGLVVIDLDADAPGLHPGGTTSEYLSLYTLVKSLVENFKEVKKVQLLVGGEAKESLAGHLDISEPLTLESF